MFKPTTQIYEKFKRLSEIPRVEKLTGIQFNTEKDGLELSNENIQLVKKKIEAFCELGQ